MPARNSLTNGPESPHPYDHPRPPLNAALGTIAQALGHTAPHTNEARSDMTPPTRAYVKNLGLVRVLSIDATHARVLTRRDLTYLVHRDRLSIRK